MPKTYIYKGRNTNKILKQKPKRERKRQEEKQKSKVQNKIKKKLNFIREANNMFHTCLVTRGNV